MHVLTHNGKLVNGPRGWDKGSFERSIKNLGSNQLVNINAPDENVIQISNDIMIYRVTEEHRPEINEKLQYHVGPYFEYTDDGAIMSFTVQDRDPAQVQGDLKKVIANNRYEKEITGVVVTIQNAEIFVETDRDNRIKFKLSAALQENNVTWKFPGASVPDVDENDTPIQKQLPEQWLTLTAADIVSINNTVTAHVQGCFDWELVKIAEIDAAITNTKLDTIVLDDI